MVQTRPLVAVTAAVLAALSLGGCAGICGAGYDASPPYARRGPPPPPPSAGAGAAVQDCTREHGLRRSRPPADGAHPAAPERQLDRPAFDGCLARKGVAPPPGTGGFGPMDTPADVHAFDGPDAADQPPGPLPYDFAFDFDSDFDAALQACATAQGIEAPLPDEPPPGPPPDVLVQCLDTAGFAPPPHHG